MRLTDTSSVTLKLQQHFKDIKTIPVLNIYLPFGSKIKLSLKDKSGTIDETIVMDEYMQEGYHSKALNLNELPTGEYLFDLETEQTKTIKEFSIK